jgi:hypothetical protein
VSLPPLDEHAVDIDAPRAVVWSALLDWRAATFGAISARRVAALLGCADVGGFHVAEEVPESVLRLAGRHRFATYELSFRLTGSTRLIAESRASFPGLAGSVYRALLLGTHGLLLAVRRMLGEIKRRSEAS